MESEFGEGVIFEIVFFVVLGVDVLVLVFEVLFEVVDVFGDEIVLFVEDELGFCMLFELVFVVCGFKVMVVFDVY